MTNVLVYVRPWNHEQFNDLAERIWPNSDLVFISEHRGFDASGFIPAFYINYEAAGKQRSNLVDGLSIIQVEDIIARCRLLRALERGAALKMVFAALSAIEDVFDQIKPKYVFSVTVDSYIIHLLSIVAKRNNVRFVGIVPTFLNGYFRITTMGEKATNRDVSQKEIMSVLNELSENKYKPAWLAATERSINRKAVYSWAKNLIKPLWFRVYSFLKRDPLNAHYLTTRIVAQRYWSFLPKRYSGFTDLAKLKSYSDKIDQTKVFLPLQMSPEATIDYWSSDISWTHYEQKIFDILDRSPDGIIYFVKEHPNVLGFRTPRFYRNLIARKNVIAIAPSVSSNDVLSLADSVLVCTGSVGFEALLRKKSVISDSQPFYAPECEFSAIEDHLSHPVVFDSINGNRDNVQLVGYLLSGLLKGTFLNDGSWKSNNELHQEYNTLVAQSLRDYLHHQ